MFFIFIFVMTLSTTYPRSYPICGTFQAPLNLVSPRKVCSGTAAEAAAAAAAAPSAAITLTMVMRMVAASLALAQELVVAGAGSSLTGHHGS